MKPTLNITQIVLRSFIHYRTNYSSFFYPLPSLKIRGELSGVNCPEGELSDIPSNHSTPALPLYLISSTIHPSCAVFGYTFKPFSACITTLPLIISSTVLYDTQYLDIHSNHSSPALPIYLISCTILCATQYLVIRSNHSTPATLHCATLCYTMPALPLYLTSCTIL